MMIHAGASNSNPIHYTALDAVLYPACLDAVPSRRLECQGEVVVLVLCFRILTIPTLFHHHHFTSCLSLLACHRQTRYYPPPNSWMSCIQTSSIQMILTSMLMLMPILLILLVRLDPAYANSN